MDHLGSHTGRGTDHAVSVITFHAGTTDADADAFTEAFMALNVEGMLGHSGGRRPQLRERDGDYAVVVDLDDDEAFWRYDRDAEHQRLRAGLAKKIVQHATACQYVI